METTAKELFDKIKTEAETLTAEPRMVRVFPEGHNVRQGDIYITPVDADLADLELLTDNQLAPGSTKGSRHVAESPAKVYGDARNTDPLLGPVVFSPERFVVSHPEHADVSLPSGTYRITYQTDFAREERARVAD